MAHVTPTTEQQAILEAARSTPDSILISALAGSAKTTTLDLIARALPVQPILSLAFNKRIAEEMTKRLPGHVASRTLNSIGHKIWSTAIGKHLAVDKDKSYGILKAVVDELPKGHRREIQSNFSEYLKAISLAKSQGYVPDGTFPAAKRLITAGDFFAGLDEDLDHSIVNLCLIRSITAGYAGSIGFDDQLYLPALFGGTYPSFGLVMVDEAQDLSPINHAMLEKLVRGRIIGVGDRYQSIYSFRGADTRSMERLTNQFSMREMTLTISFRCPSTIVEVARRHAPQMQAFTQGGRVERLVEWSAADIPDNAAIICRNNAPLFKLALALLSRGRGVKLVGSDLGPNLLRTLRRLGPEELTQKETLHAIDKWEAERLAKSRSKGSISDRADCLRVFASFGPSLGAAIGYAEHIFKVSGPIQLLSGHKSKGLGFSSVFHLDSWRIPSKWAEGAEELEQEANLDYVVTTRSSDRLTYIDMEGMIQ